MTAAMAPGPASSGVPSGTSATLTSSDAFGLAALPRPVSNCSATSSKSSPARTLQGRDADVQIVQDGLAADREHADHQQADQRRLQGGAAPVLG